MKNSDIYEYTTCKHCNNSQKIFILSSTFYTIRCERCGNVLKKGRRDSVNLYAEYLKSDHWQTTRRLALEHYGNVCAVCDTDKKLNVHHISYENKGKEKLADLKILCKKHHEEAHDIQP